MDKFNFVIQLLKGNYQPAELATLIKHFSKEDWAVLIDLSNQHHVTTILFDRLTSLEFEPEIPKTILDNVREIYLTYAVRNTLFLHEAELILIALRQAEIPVIGLKGLYLLEQVYTNIALRSMADLDLMVKKQDIPKALSILEGLGYKLTTYFNIKDENIDIKHVPPLLKGEGPYVEIHWTLLEENEPFTINAEGLWARAVPVKISGVDALALSLEDLILHLSLHLTYQHHLQLGLRGLYDIALVSNKNKDRVDWEALAAKAKEWGAERVLAVTLYLLEEILEVSTPEDVHLKLLEVPISPEILSRAKHQLLFREGDTYGVTPDLAKLSTSPGWGSKLKLVASRIFLPKVTIARIYNIDPKSFKVYFCYPRRFYQLFRRYAKSAWQILFKEEERLSDAANTQSVVALKHWLGHQD